MDLNGFLSVCPTSCLSDSCESEAFDMNTSLSLRLISLSCFSDLVVIVFDMFSTNF